MDTDQLRTIIWDDLYRSQSTASIDDLVARLQQNTEEILAAVTHEWFRVLDGQVSIATAASTSQYNSRQVPKVHHG